MFIILYGEDTFRSRQKLKELNLKERGLLEHRYAQSTTFKEIKTVLESNTLFSSSKVVVLEDLSENKELLENIAAYAGIPPNKNTTFILLERSNPQNKHFKALLNYADKKQEFKKLSLPQQVQWFSNYFSGEGININPAVIKKVANLCGGDMWQIYNELWKLCTYKNLKHEKAEITDANIAYLNIGNVEAQIFPTIDAIFKGNADRAFRGILEHWHTGEDPYKFFGMLERQLKIIALLKKDGESAAKKFGLHHYAVKKTRPIADAFDWPKIKKLYRRIESLDEKVKTGKIDPYLACELFSASVGRA